MRLLGLMPTTQALVRTMAEEILKNLLFNSERIAKMNLVETSGLQLLESSLNGLLRSLYRGEMIQKRVIAFTEMNLFTYFYNRAARPITRHNLDSFLHFIIHYITILLETKILES